MSEKDGILLAIECVNRHNHGFIKCHPMFIRGHNEAVKAITKELQSLIETAPIGGDYFEGFSEGIKVGRNEMIESARADLAAVTAERDALLARLAPVDDEALETIAARAIVKENVYKETQIPSKNIARAAIAAIRPHIEAVERERCAMVCRQLDKRAEAEGVAYPSGFACAIEIMKSPQQSGAGNE